MIVDIQPEAPADWLTTEEIGRYVQKFLAEVYEMNSFSSLLVIIPSRLANNSKGELFLQMAVNSVHRQTIKSLIKINISVGVDLDSIPPMSNQWSQIHFCVGGSTQAAALNAASAILDHELVAFLEDDDEWHPTFLETAIHGLEHVDFISSTQLEVNADGFVLGINDFPTPSGWVMKSEVWKNIARFDENYLFHLDNEWLGRLALSQFKRAHLVEATAPIDSNSLIRRPWLLNVLRNGGPNVKLIRHNQLIPLVKRTVHGKSGMAEIANDVRSKMRSDKEHELLIKRFSRIPW
jgi:hypothetical protein